jgi:hypothetical protein
LTVSNDCAQRFRLQEKKKKKVFSSFNMTTPTRYIRIKPELAAAVGVSDAALPLLPVDLRSVADFPPEQRFVTRCVEKFNDVEAAFRAERGYVVAALLRAQKLWFVECVGRAPLLVFCGFAPSPVPGSPWTRVSVVAAPVVAAAGSDAVQLVPEEGAKRFFVYPLPGPPRDPADVVSTAHALPLKPYKELAGEFDSHRALVRCAVMPAAAILASSAATRPFLASVKLSREAATDTVLEKILAIEQVRYAIPLRRNFIRVLCSCEVSGEIVNVLKGVDKQVVDVFADNRLRSATSSVTSAPELHRLVVVVPSTSATIAVPNQEAIASFLTASGGSKVTKSAFEVCGVFAAAVATTLHGTTIQNRFFLYCPSLLREDGAAAGGAPSAPSPYLEAARRAAAQSSEPTPPL